MSKNWILLDHIRNLLGLNCSNIWKYGKQYSNIRPPASITVQTFTQMHLCSDYSNCIIHFQWQYSFEIWTCIFNFNFIKRCFKRWHTLYTNIPSYGKVFKTCKKKKLVYCHILIENKIMTALKVRKIKKWFY